MVTVISFINYKWTVSFIFLIWKTEERRIVIWLIVILIEPARNSGINQSGAGPVWDRCPDWLYLNEWELDFNFWGELDRKLRFDWSRSNQIPTNIIIENDSPSVLNRSHVKALSVSLSLRRKHEFSWHVWYIWYSFV